MALLSYTELLNRATAESERLENLIQDLNKELFQMSQHYLRMGWHRGFDDYYAQRREVSNTLDTAIRHLGDSRGKVLFYRKQIAAGLVWEAAAA